MPSRTWFSMLWRTTSKLNAVRPAVISTMESKKRVRRRVLGTSVPAEGSGRVCETGSNEGAKGISANELVTHSVYRAEVYRTGGGAFQFLAKLQDVIVDGAGRGIILVSPDFVEQFIAANHAVGVLHEELQGLEFLRGQNHHLAFAHYFHLFEVNGDAVETYQIYSGRSRGMPQCRAHARQ